LKPNGAKGKALHSSGGGKGGRLNRGKIRHKKNKGGSEDISSSGRKGRQKKGKLADCKRTRFPALEGRKEETERK